MTKQYDVILADPPWSYSNSGCRGAAENEYSTMSIKQICNLDIKNISSENCVLLMWCTWPQMVEGVSVFDAWGFKYITGFPWIKVTEIQRNLFTSEIEFKVPYGIGLLSRNLYHSRKPNDIYEYAESLPGKKIELFARRKREGWDAWGNEIESDIEL